MDALDAVVAQIQGLSRTSSDIRHLRLCLNKAELTGVFQHSSWNRLGSALEKLDPSEHTLGYLYILVSYAASTSKEQAGGLISTIAKFIDSCVEEQILFEHSKFIYICRRLMEAALFQSTPIRAVAPLKKAIHKLQSTPGKLTTLHPDFLSICLLAKCYKSGFSILEEQIFDGDQPRDLFLYFYYGAMICIGEKCYRKAIELLYSVVTAPNAEKNAISIEAYKKFILVSLIKNGQFLNILPKNAPIVVSNRVKLMCKHYTSLGKIYCKWEVSELKSYVDNNREEFESDHNLGLVKQVVSSLYKRKIQRLTKAYLTLSLEDIANSAQLNSPKEAEMHVLQMIQDGELFATINQKDGMVSFHEDPERYRTCKMVEHMESSIQRIIALSKKLSDLNEIVSYDAMKAEKQRQRFEYHDYNNLFQTLNFPRPEGPRGNALTIHSRAMTPVTQLSFEPATSGFRPMTPATQLSFEPATSGFRAMTPVTQVSFEPATSGFRAMTPVTQLSFEPATSGFSESRRKDLNQLGHRVADE